MGQLNNLYVQVHENYLTKLFKEQCKDGRFSTVVRRYFAI